MVGPAITAAHWSNRPPIWHRAVSQPPSPSRPIREARPTSLRRQRLWLQRPTSRTLNLEQEPLVSRILFFFCRFTTFSFLRYFVVEWTALLLNVLTAQIFMFPNQLMKKVCVWQRDAPVHFRRPQAAASPTPFSFRHDAAICGGPPYLVFF